jgi:hypothetical protein
MKIGTQAYAKICYKEGKQNMITAELEHTMAKEKPAQPVFYLKDIFVSIIKGVAGNLVLVIFLLTFLHAFEVFRFIIWIMAFNTALAGFSLVKKPAPPSFSRIMPAAVTGFLVVAVSWMVFIQFFTVFYGSVFISFRETAIHFVIGMVFSVLGYFLATRCLKANP